MRSPVDAWRNFRERFPAIVRRERTSILKQYRGHSGRGVWKVTLVSTGTFEVDRPPETNCREI
jgi:hypothetical protein